MNNNLQRLTERRQRLIEKATEQRWALAQNMEPWRSTLARVDQGIAVLRYVKSHPVWIASAVTLLVYVAGPSRIWKWLGRGWVAWRTMYQFRSR